MPRSSLVVAAVVLLLGGPVAAPAGHAQESAEPAPVAVLELFTSEGCSSCPPADALLSQLDREMRRAGRNVLLLSFHVDYWNRLGWTDPYSGPEFTARQRSYARALPSRTYTPQLVVNGRAHVVGSRGPAVRAAIDDALASPPAHAVTVAREGDGLAYRIDPEPPSTATLELALVERGLSQAVLRGENRGRRLRHDNVVRSLDRLPWRRAAGWRSPSARSSGQPARRPGLGSGRPVSGRSGPRRSERPDHGSGNVARPTPELGASPGPCVGSRGGGNAPVVLIRRASGRDRRHHGPGSRAHPASRGRGAFEPLCVRVDAVSTHGGRCPRCCVATFGRPSRR